MPAPLEPYFKGRSILTVAPGRGNDSVMSIFAQLGANKGTVSSALGRKLAGDVLHDWILRTSESDERCESCAICQVVPR